MQIKVAYCPKKKTPKGTVQNYQARRLHECYLFWEHVQHDATLVFLVGFDYPPTHYIATVSVW